MTRNLALTWLVLLPMLFSVVLAGQLYFVLQSNSTTEFFTSVYSTKQKFEKQEPEQMQTPAGKEQADPSVTGYIKKRVFLAATPLLLLSGWIVLMIMLWMSSNITVKPFLDWIAHMVGTVAVLLLMYWAYRMYKGFKIVEAPFELSDLITQLGVIYAKRPGLFIVVGLWVVISALLWAYTWIGTVGSKNTGGLKEIESEDGKAERKQWRKELRKSKIVRIHATLLVTFVLVAFALALAGFGHEIADYFLLDPVPRESLANIVAKSGGWLALIMAVAGSIFTAIKTSPTGGQDAEKKAEPSATAKLIFAITPPLVLLVMGVLLAKFSHWLLGLFNSRLQVYENNSWLLSDHMDWLTLAVCIAFSLSFFFAIYEMRRWREDWRRGSRGMEKLWAYRRIQWGRVLGLFLLGLLVILLPVLLQLISGSRVSPLFRKSFLPALSLFLIILAVILLLYEMWGRDKYGRVAQALVNLGIVLTGGVMFFLAARWLLSGIQTVESAIPLDHGYWVKADEAVNLFDYRYRYWVLVLVGLLGVPIIVRLFMWKRNWFERAVNASMVRKRVLYACAIALAWTCSAIVFIYVRSLGKAETGPMTDWSFMFLGAMLYCAVLTALEMAFGDHDNVRSVWLLTSSYALLAMFIILSFFAGRASFIEGVPTLHSSATLGYIALGLLTTALAWTVALGWMVNPNLLTLHLFYKNRLVRAYLGASNPHRDTQQITEAAENDDVRLSKLKNCESGGPYHLINTTLNLVGGRDLATSQRHSAAFILSKHFCGSLRTGYRPTSSYMAGNMTLGTAVAVSGAAVSPNMGAKSQTASLAMLMTLLNVRLGYWAPTPNQGSWQAPHARLWPFYTLYEFLSQTNDLSSFCYLTDGAHFDNTGLYSLVERGCRYIVVVDNSGDPDLYFEDLGDAIRRCRIDFGADIDINLSPLFRKSDSLSKDDFVEEPFVVGHITYSKKHFQWLNRRDDDANRKGVIILIKPSLIDPEPLKDSSQKSRIPADVRQYARQNKLFPQQGTGDQWFDEAQFESYRRLGEICADAVFKKAASETGMSNGSKINAARVKSLFESIGKKSTLQPGSRPPQLE
jgi:hypothetical protein